MCVLIGIPRIAIVSDTKRRRKKNAVLTAAEKERTREMFTRTPSKKDEKKTGLGDAVAKISLISFTLNALEEKAGHVPYKQKR